MMRLEHRCARRRGARQHGSSPLAELLQGLIHCTLLPCPTTDGARSSTGGLTLTAARPACSDMASNARRAPPADDLGPAGSEVVIDSGTIPVDPDCVLGSGDAVTVRCGGGREWVDSLVIGPRDWAAGAVGAGSGLASGAPRGLRGLPRHAGAQLPESRARVGQVHDAREAMSERRRLAGKGCASGTESATGDGATNTWTPVSTLPGRARGRRGASRRPAGSSARPAG